jgi:type VI protein secretion system component VasK
LRTTNSGPNVAAMTAWVREDFDLVTRVLDEFQTRADWPEYEDFQRRLDKDCAAARDMSQLWDQAPIGVTDSGLFTSQGYQRFVRPRLQEQLDESRRSADWHG